MAIDPFSIEFIRNLLARLIGFERGREGAYRGRYLKEAIREQKRTAISTWLGTEEIEDKIGRPSRTVHKCNVAYFLLEHFSRGFDCPLPSPEVLRPQLVFAYL